MKKKYLKIGRSAGKFKSFLKEAGLLGFAPISPEREQRNQIMQGVVPPDSPRIDQLAGQVILQKQVDNYTIRVIPGYDPVAKKFTAAGKFWVRITTLSKRGVEGRVSTWKTTRTFEFRQRALYMMEILATALEHRPYDPSNRTLLMELEEVEHGPMSRYTPFVWRGRREGDSTVPFIHAGMLRNDKDLISFFNTWLRRRWNYEETRDKKKKREREIRKPYKRGVRKKSKK